MALTLVVRSGVAQELPSITFDAPRVVIGRGQGCELCLPDPSVSHRHASIRQRGPDYIVVDEGSTNGTFVGPVCLPPHTPRVLRSGDLLRVGRIWIEAVIEHAAPTPQSHLATRELALALVAGALSAEGESAAVEVRVEAGPDAGKTLTLAKVHEPYIVGRGGRTTKPALSLLDDDASRRHVELQRRGGKVFVRDLGSKNGSVLDGTPLLPDKPAHFRPGACLELGKNALVLVDPVSDAFLELEQAADEEMSQEEDVPPPERPGEGEEPELASPLPAANPEQLSGAPIAVLPSRRSTVRPRRRGWSVTDFLVALLALLVLGTSVAGLLWLFRTM